MGNMCNKLYYSIPQRQKCPYCTKSPFISETETAFKISTQGCRVCRIKMKYYFKPINDKKHPTNTFIKKPSYDKVYDTDPFNNVTITQVKVKGRYY
tara:strand:+ start:54 stop:341 length:288 start_codon:yes stop_codon:yes gene_type:complete